MDQEFEAALQQHQGLLKLLITGESALSSSEGGGCSNAAIVEEAIFAVSDHGSAAEYKSAYRKAALRFLARRDALIELIDHRKSGAIDILESSFSDHFTELIRASIRITSLRTVSSLDNLEAYICREIEPDRSGADQSVQVRCYSYAEKSCMGSRELWLYSFLLSACKVPRSELNSLLNELQRTLRRISDAMVKLIERFDGSPEVKTLEEYGESIAARIEFVDQLLQGNSWEFSKDIAKKLVQAN